MRKLVILLWTFACTAVQASSHQDVADPFNPKINAAELAELLSPLQSPARCFIDCRTTAGSWRFRHASNPD